MKTYKITLSPHKEAIVQGVNPTHAYLTLVLHLTLETPENHEVVHFDDCTIVELNEAKVLLLVDGHDAHFNIGEI